MSKRSIYKIKVTNWDKHNSHQKKSHKKTMISNNFCSDAKLKSVPITTRWVFLNLLMMCGNQCRDVVEISSRTLRECLECNRNIVGVLDQLQSLQLLTYEIILPLIEVKRSEVKRSEVVEAKASTSPTAEKSAAARKTNKPKVLTLKVETVQQLADCITKPVWNQWQLSFSDDYIQDEMAKACMWLLNNPKVNHKTPLGISRFMTGWLTRGWDKHLKKYPARQKQPEFNL